MFVDMLETMTRSILLFVAYALSLSGLILWGCGKEEKPTILEGKVIDAKTGEGLSKALISFLTRPVGSDENSGNSIGILTDSSGSFRIEANPGLLIGNFAVQKMGYFGKVFLHNPTQRGETIQILIVLQPADSALKLTVKNTNGQFDSIYVHLSNATVEFPGIPQPVSPLVLSAGEEKSAYLLCPSGSWTTIKWANTKLGFIQSPKIDSIYSLSHDTTEFVISY